jgi:hypothetical protein
VITRNGVLLVTALSTAGLTASSNKPADYTTLLWIPDGAVIEPIGATPARVINGRAHYVDGSADVVFSSTIPPLDLFTALMRRMESTEWRPRTNQYMNPQLETSFRPGRPPQPSPLFGWHGEWENGRGDILFYGFREQRGGSFAYATFVPVSSVRLVLKKLLDQQEGR